MSGVLTSPGPPRQHTTLRRHCAPTALAMEDDDAMDALFASLPDSMVSGAAPQPPASELEAARGELSYKAAENTNLRSTVAQLRKQLQEEQGRAARAAGGQPDAEAARLRKQVQQLQTKLEFSSQRQREMEAKAGGGGGSPRKRGAGSASLRAAAVQTDAPPPVAPAPAPAPPQPQPPVADEQPPAAVQKRKRQQPAGRDEGESRGRPSARRAVVAPAVTPRERQREVRTLPLYLYPPDPAR